MGSYLVRRLLIVLPVVLLVSFGTFSLMELAPGDAASIRLGEEADPAQVEALREELGLNRNFMVRYLDWVYHAAQGDLGDSVRSHRPVSDLIIDRLPPTIWLGTGAIILALLVSIPVGVISAVAPRSKRDTIGTYVTTVGIALPEFVIGVLMVLLLAIRLRWLPTSGWVDPLDDPVSGIRHLILPWITLAGASTAVLTRMVRSSMLEVLNQDYIRTARAKGLLTIVVLSRHALRNALLSTVTLLGLIARRLIGGAVVVEVLFAIPGMGRLLVDSLTSKDTDAILGVVAFIAIGVVLINTLVDITYGMLDPRIRTS